MTALEPTDDDWTPPLPAGTELDETGIPRPLDPDLNPAWSADASLSKRMGVLRMPINAKDAISGLAQIESSTQSVSQLMRNELDHLDHQIWDMRTRAIPSMEIAKRLGNGMTAEQVQQRIHVIVDRFDKLSVTEMRALQVARMEGIINMLYSRMETGDIPATDMLLRAMERVNKMWELESEKMTVEVTIVNKAQTDVILATVGMMLDSLRPLLERAPENTPEIIDGVVISVIETASEMMQEARTPRPFDTKTGELGMVRR